MAGKRQVLFGGYSRQKLLKGGNLLGDAVKVTAGPHGRTVVIGGGNMRPRITKDGVTVARSIICPDPMEEMGATLVREAASQTVDQAGDGTTTATILAQSMINDAVKAVDSGANPVALKVGIQQATQAVIEHIKSMAIPVREDGDLLINIATISANNDPELGLLVANVVQKVGKEGIITIEESQTSETRFSVVEGMNIERGYMSPYFITDSAKNKCEYNDVHVMICDKEISSLTDMIPILGEWMKEKKPLLIIATDIVGEVFGTLCMNRSKHNLPICTVKVPGVGDLRKAILEDIAIVTGGKVISEDKGLPLKDVTIADLGHAAKIVVYKDKTVIIGGKGTPQAIKDRCDNLTSQIESATHKNEGESIKRRIASISNSVAVVYVGGVTETEVSEKKDRIDDAKCATQAAMEEGIVYGGGITYLKCIGECNPGTPEDMKLGAQIVFRALEAPFKQILANAGITDNKKWYNIFGDSPYRKILKKIQSAPNGFGMNVKTGEFGDMMKFGIVDPAKVARVALENASAVACLFLTTECVSGDLGEDK